MKRYLLLIMGLFLAFSLGRSAVLLDAQEPDPPSPPPPRPPFPLDGVLDPGDWDEAVLLSSRGCACGCLFCITPAATGRRVRQHSVERVLAELEWVATRGSGRVWFADPNLATDRRQGIGASG